MPPVLQLTKDGQKPETFWEKTRRKMSENPFIFPAVGLTLVGIYRMTAALWVKDKLAFQKAQRFRVASQLAAVLAFAGGIAYHSLPKNEQEAQEWKLKREQEQSDSK